MRKDENVTRTKIKAFLASNGTTLTDVVKVMNERHPDEPTTQQNITNKLARETIKFKEVVEIADILGYDIAFKKRHGINCTHDDPYPHHVPQCLYERIRTQQKTLQGFHTLQGFLFNPYSVFTSGIPYITNHCVFALHPV